MKNILGILFLLVFLASCGGGATASGGSGVSNAGGNAPLGSFAGQVDPVQATD